MQTASTVDELRQLVRTARQAGKTIGCVPTMGALHPGHISLVDVAKSQTDFVVVTIFVNPTQFGPNEDFKKYPRPLERDLQLCREANVDLVFHPDVEDVYPPGASSFVDVENVSMTLEGACRPGHFRGVATIVLKLFNMVQPDVAFFGQKDYQQQLLIKQMVRDLNVPVRIHTCPTRREPDGLAMSSRNVYLNPEERRTALLLSQALNIAQQLCQQPGTTPVEVDAAMNRHLSSDPRVRVEYATLVDAQTLVPLRELQAEMVAVIAARVGTTRLIDNMLIEQCR